ncbi:MAG TPA: SMC-Scp complex subunit ScpB [Candidatus Limnocylindria bacterium]|nr:SMC-Scp complex subunit ScpB [Candidatus Limnocylindria bacterium]
MQPELLETGSLQRDLEALLFVASEALSIKQLAKLTGAEESDVTVALQKIDEEFSHRGVVLREIAGGYRFASSPAAREAVERYLMPPKTNLSPAALETLAIVAYMQPVTRGEIEGIRGVSADSVVATLVDRRFLAESGRKDVPGRPVLYKTTPEFLEAFGLRSLEELPPIDVDGTAPVELALPIPTQAVPREAQAAESDEELPDEPQAEASAAEEPQAEAPSAGEPQADVPPAEEAQPPEGDAAEEPVGAHDEHEEERTETEPQPSPV